MRFRLLDINSDSKSVKYSFENDGSIQLHVKTLSKRIIFIQFALYSIKVSLELCDANENTQMGVVTRLTRNSTHIQCGVTHWMFPKSVCPLKPGTAVWLTFRIVDEYS